MVTVKASEMPTLVTYLFCEFNETFYIFFIDIENFYLVVTNIESFFPLI